MGGTKTAKKAVQGGWGNRHQQPEFAKNYAALDIARTP